jgi:hypothetical protein
VSLARVLLALAVLGAGLWILRSQHLIGPPPVPEAERAAPIDRARAAARASDARNAQTEEAARALDSRSSGGNAVSEDMTPEQVRALLGQPDGVESSTNELGTTIEKWTYRQAGKTVVFENGLVARVE